MTPSSTILVNNYLHHIKDLVLPRLPPSTPIWEVGRSPLSTFPTATAALMGYVGFVWGLQEFMRRHKPLQLNGLAKAHNIFLSAGSFVLLALFSIEIAPIIVSKGFFHAVCNVDTFTPNMELYYVITYYSKFYELLDTVFLALKKKPLAFIHVFHHAATPLLGLVVLNSRIIMAWFPVGLNLAVHVLMYYYYYASAGGHKIWWKKYITTIQIGQFVLDGLLGYFVAYAYYASNYFPNLPAPKECSKSGTGLGLLSGCVMTTIYFFLFSSFYKDTYKPPSSSKTSFNGTSKP